MAARQEFETFRKLPDLTPGEVTEALDAWARADGGRAVSAVVHLLTASGLAESWRQFPEHLELTVYTDPGDPEPTPYTVARVINWSSLHNAIPSDVGKSALGLFVYARALGDRGFVVCLSDLLDGMEPNTQRIVHEANAIRFGVPRTPAWDRRREPA